MRAALIASLIAGPALAQDGGASLPVFPTPSDRLPQVREREAPTVRQNTLPGINVVPRSVWGTRPRPRPVEGDALVAAPEQPEAAAESVAAVVDDLLPGLTDRVAQGAVAPAPLVPGAADATPATLPAPAPGPVFIQAQAVPPPQTRPVPRGSAILPEGIEVAPPIEVMPIEVVDEPEPETPSNISPVIEDVLNALREEETITQPGVPLPELRPAEDIITGTIVVETLTSTTSDPLGLRPRAAPVEAVDRANGAVLRGLDKVSGDVRDIELSVGETAQLGRLSVSLTECRYPVANPAGNAYAWLDITVEGLSDPAFQGWMMAARPALSALDHPRYDVWVIRCNNS